MNIVHKSIKIYAVQNELDVVVGESFFMEFLQDFPAEVEVYTNKDAVLSIAEDDRTVTVEKVGTSTIKFMTNDGVHKSLKINAVDATHPAATDLGGKLLEPVKK